jgi:hypothetical protein
MNRARFYGIGGRDEEEQTVLTTEEARSGETTGNVRRVLFVSLGFATVAGAILIGTLWYLT